MKAWALAAGALVAAAAAFAQPATTLLRDSELRADKLPDAAVVASLSRGAPVRLLARFGGWAQVEAAGAPSVRGWLRAGVLDGATQVAAAAMLPSGRTAAGADAVTLGIRGTPSAVRWHAILVTASPHDRPLHGLAADRASMEQVLAATPVRWVSVRRLDGDAVSTEGVLAAIAEVVRDARAGDGLLLHVAAAGTRIATGHGCVEALQLAAGTLTGAELGHALLGAASQGLQVVGAYDAGFDTGGARFVQGTGCAQQAVPFEDAVAAAAQPGRPFVQWRLTGGSADDADDGGLLTEALRDCTVGTGSQDALADAPAAAIGRCMAARIAHGPHAAKAAPSVRTQGSAAWAPWRDPADQWGR